MQTIQSPYSLHQKLPMEEATSAYDLIQQIERKLKEGGALDSGKESQQDNPMNHHISHLTQDISFLEAKKKELSEEISLIKR